jgi:mono/diheme cytochrome c family protein
MVVFALAFALRISLSILIPAIALAQSPGEKIFNQTCATGYCHGVKGVAGGAPRLVGRGFDAAYINATVARGIAGTAMPAFASTLSKGDLAAVAAYVAALNGIANSAAVSGTPQELSPDAARGRELFSEAARSFGRCATCHEVNGIGIPVATPIGMVPTNVAGLRTLTSPHVRTATSDAETMPALVVSEGRRGTILYDLTASPPVERSFEPGTVKVVDGSTWKHASAIAGYNDAELAAILAYLREAVRQ